MATVSTAPRTTTITLATATAGPFDLSFRLFDTNTISVYVNGEPRTDWTLVDAVFTDGYMDGAQIEFSASLEIGDVIVVDADLSPRRGQDYENGDPRLTAKLNVELGRLWSAMADVKRDTKRSLRTSGEVDRPVAIAEDAVPIWNGEHWESGPTAADIANAQGYANDAAASADRAELAAQALGSAVYGDSVAFEVTAAPMTVTLIGDYPVDSVYIGGVAQRKGDGWTQSGDQLTINVPRAVGATAWYRYQVPEEDLGLALEAYSAGTTVRLSFVSGTGSAATYAPIAEQADLTIEAGMVLRFRWAGVNAAAAPTLTVGGNTYVIRDQTGRDLAPGELTDATYLATVMSSTGVRLIGVCWQATRPALDFGAEGDGTTDDTAAFATIPAGQTVDLMGRVYEVTSVRSDVRFQNGAFVVGGKMFQAPKRALGPFEGQLAVVETQPIDFWVAGIAHHQTSETLFGWQIVTSQHDGVDGAWLDQLKSPDGGVTWSGRQTIYSNTTLRKVISGALGKMDSGRAGGLLSLNTLAGASTDRKVYFARNDDANWSAGAWVFTELTLPLYHFIYGQIVQGYSFASGDWMIASYGHDSTAKFIRTTDNGATWTDGQISDAVLAPGVNCQEPSICPVPGFGHACFCRPSDNSNLYVSLRPLGGAWSSWVNTGFLLGPNQIHSYYADGRVALLICDRDPAFAGGGDQPGVVQQIELDPVALFADPTVISRTAPVDVAQMPGRPTGYFMTTRIPPNTDADYGPIVSIGKSAESVPNTSRGSGAAMVRLGQVPAAPLRREPSRQMTRNSGFAGKARPFASLASAATASRALADRWAVTSGSNGGARAAIAADWAALTEAQAKLMPFCTHGITLNGGPGNYMGLLQRFLGRDAVDFAQAVADGGRAVARIYGIGECPALRVAVAVNDLSVTGSGGTALAVGADQAGGWVREVELQLGDLPIARAVDATSAHVAIDNGTTVNSPGFTNATICGVELWLGVTPPPFARYLPLEPTDPRYVQVLSGTNARVLQGRAAGTAVAYFLAPAMAALPAVSTSDVAHLSIETSADFAVSGLTVAYPTTWVDIAPVRIDAAASGLTAGHAAQLEITNASGWLMLDTGY